MVLCLSKNRANLKNNIFSGYRSQIGWAILIYTDKKVHHSNHDSLMLLHLLLLIPFIDLFSNCPPQIKAIFKTIHRRVFKAFVFCYSFNTVFHKFAF